MTTAASEVRRFLRKKPRPLSKARREEPCFVSTLTIAELERRHAKAFSGLMLQEGRCALNPAVLSCCGGRGFQLRVDASERKAVRTCDLMLRFEAFQRLLIAGMNALAVISAVEQPQQLQGDLQKYFEILDELRRAATSERLRFIEKSQCSLSLEILACLWVWRGGGNGFFVDGSALKSKPDLLLQHLDVFLRKSPANKWVFIDHCGLKTDETALQTLDQIIARVYHAGKVGLVIAMTDAMPVRTKHSAFSARLNQARQKHRLDFLSAQSLSRLAEIGPQALQKFLKPVKSDSSKRSLPGKSQEPPL